MWILGLNSGHQHWQELLFTHKLPLAQVYLVKKACVLWPVNDSSIKLVLNIAGGNVAFCYLEANLMKEEKNNKE